MRPRSMPLFLLPCLASLVSLASFAPTALAGPRDLSGEPAVVERALNADPKDVYDALRSALSSWRFQKTSLEQGIVKTSWNRTERLREVYRDRVVAEFRQDGYMTHLTVRHERQRQMKELRQTITAGGAPWQDWDGNWELARDVLRSVEQGLGLEAPALDLNNLSGRPRATEDIVIQREFVVPPAVAPKVNELKAKRKSLVTEIKAIDGRILAAVYDGRYQEIKDEVEKLKARKAGLQSQVAEIDREILQLVLAEQGDQS